MHESRLHFERAHEALQAAEGLVRDGLLRDAASRSYYAMYHAAFARLLEIGHAPKTHRGLVALFAQHLVADGPVEKDLLDALTHAKELREEGDYEVAAVPEEDEVTRLITQAADFIARLEA